MRSLDISIVVEGVIKKAQIECDRQKLSLVFRMECGITKSYSAGDLFICFGMLRAEFPNIKFLCKGSKLNVYPSRMSSQMSAGVVAYEMVLGRPAESEDVVRIFDFEDENITNNIEEQRDFYNKWIDSLTD